MGKELAEKLIDEILVSMNPPSIEGWPHAFMYGEPGEPSFSRRFGTTIHYNRSKLIKAALTLRNVGPLHYRYQSINDVCSQIREFISNNYGHISKDVILNNFTCSYNEIITQESRTKLKNALINSSILNPEYNTVLFPLNCVEIVDDFIGESFFLASCNSLTNTVTGVKLGRHPKPCEFPPFAVDMNSSHTVDSWLGVRSPDKSFANRARAAVLGSLAISMCSTNRYVFTIQKYHGGYCLINNDGSKSFSLGPSHTPSLSTHIKIIANDHKWLAVLADLIQNTTKNARRKVRALQYYYRAWPLIDRERFAWHCMALDAIFGESGRAAQAVIDKVRDTVKSNIDEKRLRALLDLRASVLHGGAPDVVDSSKYQKYFITYGDDPIKDLEVILTKCLRINIFGDLLREQDDPYADIVNKAISDGKIPRDYYSQGILEQ